MTADDNLWYHMALMFLCLLLLLCIMKSNILFYAYMQRVGRQAAIILLALFDHFCCGNNNEIEIELNSKASPPIQSSSTSGIFDLLLHCCKVTLPLSCCCFFYVRWWWWCDFFQNCLNSGRGGGHDIELSSLSCYYYSFLLKQALKTSQEDSTDIIRVYSIQHRIIKHKLHYIFCIFKMYAYASGLKGLVVVSHNSSFFCCQKLTKRIMLIS